MQGAGPTGSVDVRFRLEMMGGVTGVRARAESIVATGQRTVQTCRMTPYRTILAAALAVLPTLAASQTPAGWSAFTRTFQAYVDSDKVVGASVVLANEGRVVGRYDTGFADRGVKVDSATIYHW